MASPAAIAWVERLIWILVYAGLFAIVVGVASMETSPAGAWALIVLGALATVAGAILVWVRSVLVEPH